MFAKTLDISEARNQFNRMDERLREEHVIVVTRHSKKAFAVVDFEYLESLLETIEILSTPGTYEMLLQAMDDIKSGRLHDHEDVKKELLG